MATRVREPDGGLKLDEIREPQFDSIDLTAADTASVNTLNATRNYFTNTQNKSAQQTNMVQPSQFSQGTSFRCTGISYDVQTNIPALRKAIPLLVENSALTFVVLSKNYWQANLMYIAGRIESEIAVATGVAATDVADVFQRAGDSFIAQTSFDADHSRNIPELTNFSVQVVTEGITVGELAQFGAIPADFRLRTFVSLKGLKRRPVQ